MFSVQCPRHGASVLLGPDNIASMTNGPDGLELHWVCWCGERGVETFGASGAAGALTAGAVPS